MSEAMAKKRQENNEKYRAELQRQIEDKEARLKEEKQKEQKQKYQASMLIAEISEERTKKQQQIETEKKRMIMEDARKR